MMTARKSTRKRTAAPAPKRGSHTLTLGAAHDAREALGELLRYEVPIDLALRMRDLRNALRDALRSRDEQVQVIIEKQTVRDSDGNFLLPDGAPEGSVQFTPAGAKAWAQLHEQEITITVAPLTVGDLRSIKRLRPVVLDQLGSLLQ